MPILSPKTTLNIIGAQEIQAAAAQRVLLVGQMLTGSAVAGVVSRDVSSSETEINALFGAKSHIAELARKFKSVNKNTALDVLPIADNGAGVAASATLTFGGLATEDGSFDVYVMDKINYRATISVIAGDDDDAVAAKVDAALSALETKWPFSTTSATNVVTLTASNKGTIYNSAPVGVEGSVAGITYTLAAFASGATDPVLTGILAATGNMRYQTISWPASYATTVLTTFLNARFNDEFEVLDGVGLTGKVDIFSNLSAGPSQNSQSLVVKVDNLLALDSRKGPACQQIIDSQIAIFAAVRSLRLTEDASLSGIVTTVAARDQFGGSGASTLPYHNSILPGIAVPLPEDEFSLLQFQSLVEAGYSISSANKAYNAVILGDAVTTYKTNGAGDPDTSFKYLNRVDSSSAIREFFVNNYRARYAQSRLTNGEIVAGRDMVNEGAIRAFSKRLYENLADDAIVEKGQVAAKDFNQNLLIEVSVSGGFIRVDMAPLQVGQVRTILGTIAVKFSS